MEGGLSDREGPSSSETGGAGENAEVCLSWAASSEGLPTFCVAAGGGGGTGTWRSEGELSGDEGRRVAVEGQPTPGGGPLGLCTAVCGRCPSSCPVRRPRWVRGSQVKGSERLRCGRLRGQWGDVPSPQGAGSRAGHSRSQRGGPWETVAEASQGRRGQEPGAGQGCSAPLPAPEPRHTPVSREGVGRSPPGKPAEVVNLYRHVMLLDPAVRAYIHRCRRRASAASHNSPGSAAQFFLPVASCPLPP